MLKFESLFTFNMTGVQVNAAVNFYKGLQVLFAKYRVDDYRLDDCSDDAEKVAGCDVLEGNSYLVCDTSTLDMFRDLLHLANKYKIPVTQAGLYSR